MDRYNQIMDSVRQDGNKKRALKNVSEIAVLSVDESPVAIAMCDGAAALAALYWYGTHEGIDVIGEYYELADRFKALIDDCRREMLHEVKQRRKLGGAGRP